MKLYAVILTVLLTSCVRVVPKEHGNWNPRPHPTQEQIWALTDPTHKTEAGEVALKLTIYPVLPLVYNDVRLVCQMPNILGHYEFGSMDGKFRYSGAINGERKHYMNIGCESIEFYCSYAEYVPQQGYKRPKRVELKVTPAGECR